MAIELEWDATGDVRPYRLQIWLHIRGNSSRTVTHLPAYLPTPLTGQGSVRPPFKKIGHTLHPNESLSRSALGAATLLCCFCFGSTWYSKPSSMMKSDDRREIFLARLSPAGSSSFSKRLKISNKEESFAAHQQNYQECHQLVLQ